MAFVISMTATSLPALRMMALYAVIMPPCMSTVQISDPSALVYTCFGAPIMGLSVLTLNSTVPDSSMAVVVEDVIDIPVVACTLRVIGALATSDASMGTIGGFVSTHGAASAAALARFKPRTIAADDWVRSGRQKTKGGS